MLHPDRNRDGGTLVAHGAAYVWDQAGWGDVVEDTTYAFATKEITAVAGAAQFGSTEPRAVVERLKLAAEGMLGAAGGGRRGTAVELRYVTEPITGKPTRLRLFLTAKTSGSERSRDLAASVESTVEAACAALPDGYQWRSADPAATDPVIDDEAVLIEVRRQEEVTPPLLVTVPADYYYAAYPLHGDGSGWARFLQLLAQCTEPVAVSLLFMPTSLDPYEQETIGVVASELRYHAETRQEQNFLGMMDYIQGDANAAAVLPTWDGYLQSLRHCLLARMTVRASPRVATHIARALASAISANRDATTGPHPQLITQRARDDKDRVFAEHSWRWLDIVPWGGHPFWSDEGAPNVLRRLPYLYSLSESAAAAVLPVPDEQGAVGFARARRMSTRRITLTDSEELGPFVSLGDFLHEGQPAGDAPLPLSAINRHVLVVGAPGSGKTTTVLSLLAHLWRVHRIPFLAIEPTKTEYRTLLQAPGMDGLRVITLGRDDIAPIRLNPLAPPPGVRREVHMSAVMAAFRAALPLDPPLPQLLEEALERAYELAGWTYSTTPEDGRRPPTLRDLLAAYEDGFSQHGYSGEVRDNLLAALRLRLRSLTRGTRGLLLDTVESIDFAALMTVPVVIELDEIADRDDKAILSAFLLDRIRAAARARGTTGGRLAHVTVLEEAHRLLSRMTGVDGDTPQSAAIRSFCDAIAELRALGEGFVISSQSPSALAEAAVANTGTRILHRMESAADRNIVLSDLDASPLEREAAARLHRGEAVVRWPQRDEAEIVRVKAAEGIDSGTPVSDVTVAERMREQSDAVRRLLPYRLCTRDVCQGGCSAVVRPRGEQIAKSNGGEARKLWKQHQGTAESLAPISAVVAQDAGGDVQLAYCGAVHLSIQQDAFLVPRKDIRPQLAVAIREAVRSE